jgi:hypothetical protein
MITTNLHPKLMNIFSTYITHPNVKTAVINRRLYRGNQRQAVTGPQLRIYTDALGVFMIGKDATEDRYQGSETCQVALGNAQALLGMYCVDLLSVTI